MMLGRVAGLAGGILVCVCVDLGVAGGAGLHRSTVNLVSWHPPLPMLLYVQAVLSRHSAVTKCRYFYGDPTTAGALAYTFDRLLYLLSVERCSHKHAYLFCLWLCYKAHSSDCMIKRQSRGQLTKGI